jgi:hypothetical protein
MRADDVQRMHLQTDVGSSSRPDTSTHAPLLDIGGSSSCARPTARRGERGSSSRARPIGGQDDGGSSSSEDDPNDPPYELGGHSFMMLQIPLRCVSPSLHPFWAVVVWGVKFE